VFLAAVVGILRLRHERTIAVVAVVTAGKQARIETS
jgi:hypothetical protein